MADQPLGHSTNFLVVDTSADRDVRALAPDGVPRFNRWIFAPSDGTLVVVDRFDVTHTFTSGMLGRSLLLGVKTIKDTSTCSFVEIAW